MTTQHGDAPKISQPKKLKAYKYVYRTLAGAAFLLITVGTVAYHFLEDWSWVDSLYFSVVAVTTVGFGDLSPSTDASKLFTVLYILLGITIVTTFLNNRFKYKAYERAHTGMTEPDPDSSKTEGEL